MEYSACAESLRRAGLSAAAETLVTSNVQCVRLAAGRRTQAGDATDEWREQ